MQLKLLTAGAEVPQEVHDLYHASFPLYERRPWPDQVLLLRDGAIALYLVFWEEAFAGFLFAWPLSSFYLIEYFAIVPAMRNAGIGGKAMRAAMQTFKNIVLETEPAAQSALAQRRMDFYQRLGFRVFEEDYFQPPYAANYPPLPMSLLYYGDTLAATQFNILQEEIHRRVYNYKAD
ncbi:MAG TPA: GNAT family N-acetyltransferase [Chitinophagaceae bacterium]|nr:GNAT family N-acetyltransferase [Chitinophagaceae bacterium]